jgi:putative oxidoreductase
MKGESAMTRPRVFEINRNWTVNDAGLLIFRVLVSASLFAHHGWEKLAHFNHMAQHFPDPLHLGVKTSLLYAAFADGICSILVALGLATRVASFIAVVNLTVVYVVVENALGIGASARPGPGPGMGPGPAMPGPPPGAHSELVFVYLMAYLLLTIVGPGGFSLDRKLER